MKHSITAGGVVIGQDGRVIVVSQHGNSWSLPKGHVDPGEDLLAAAKREIEEETGVTQLEFVRNLGSYDRYAGGNIATGELKHITMFLFSTNETRLQPQDPDNPEARWIKRETVADLLTFDGDKEFFKNVLQFLQ